MSNSSLVVIGADFADTLCCCISGSEVYSELSARTEKKGGGCVSNNVALVLGWAVLSGRAKQDWNRPRQAVHDIASLQCDQNDSHAQQSDSK